ncbi:PREDICTED: E3 ubiquitin protein ligase DRIP1-like [Camelina sativa]|uniref:E3 ubiquitin protein ligase DRIP1-like n=1 Tax=Camelina sativa TaxID=90675 RepID=A0ABM0U6L2_CAMSA|nr:PREDICTED: E3 ubiquitin protein ligase DRIP1-like [Camelina sativa]
MVKTEVKLERDDDLVKREVKLERDDDLVKREVKLERDDGLETVEPVRLSTGFVDRKFSTLSSEDIKEEKVVEPLVQDNLQNTISSCATKKRNIPIWLSLVASNGGNKNAPLRQISPTYMRIKNSYMQLSYLKKYVAKKLDLKTEDEVGLYLENELLNSSTMLFDLWERWVSTKRDVDIKNFEAGSSSADYVMVVNYGRNMNM